MPTEAPREAIVLAGGFGTRLRAVVSDVPKPLAPVAGRPFLAWLLDALERGGLKRVVLATGYLGEMVEAAIGARHGAMQIAYVREEQPLGTGGSLWAAMAATTGERVFALNGDTWQSADYAAMAQAAPEADLVFAVRPVEDRARYGSVVLEEGRPRRPAREGRARAGAGEFRHLSDRARAAGQAARHGRLLLREGDPGAAGGPGCPRLRGGWPLHRHRHARGFFPRTDRAAGMVKIEGPAATAAGAAPLALPISASVPRRSQGGGAAARRLRARKN
ncbi:sugar phosphate nucleotidyltransferase [Roseococcus sp.]|uniref:sugar phosphate nucleotidyltransferase n=1 Tax=Roseococcus sp. TaxID=2109646 RepID=UPI003BABBBC3